MICWRQYLRFFLGISLAIVTSLVLNYPATKVVGATASLPPLQPHPLPSTLKQWQDQESVGDYFSQIKPSPVGYLIWSRFPIAVYIDRPANPTENSASTKRFHQWVEAIDTARKEWNHYIPLVAVDNPDRADIIIRRSLPSRQVTIDPETNSLQIPPARTAETHYRIYQTQDSPPLLHQRMTIEISPGLSAVSTLAAARHELGHALGIWGHSDRATDVMYSAQVSDPPPISPRDINTLKKIYQQPTRLGWAISIDGSID